MEHLLALLTDRVQLDIIQFYGQNPAAAVNAELLAMFTGRVRNEITPALAHLSVHQIVTETHQLIELQPEWRAAAINLSITLSNPAAATRIYFQLAPQEERV